MGELLRYAEGCLRTDSCALSSSTTVVCVKQVLDLWFKMIANDEKFFRRLYDKKLCCAGLICLLSVPCAQLPVALSASLHTVRTPSSRVADPLDSDLPMFFTSPHGLYNRSDVCCCRFCGRLLRC